jgi:hypothetical protein
MTKPIENALLDELIAQEQEFRRVHMYGEEPSVTLDERQEQ